MIKLKKELFIIIGILSFIILLELVTNKITDESINIITEKANKINTNLNEINKKEKSISNYEKMKYGVENEIKNLKEEWLLKKNKLSIFSEHNELEKVSKCLITLEENTKNEEYNIALEDGKELVYWLEYIKEKDKLKIKNIF